LIKLEHRVEDLETLFNELFESAENTLLVSGGDEPIYLPASETGNTNKVITTKNYFSSALHEVSHWCLAGLERRKLIDYGYWYEPDGRTEQQQRLFEQVEIKPQALEWIFTVATAQKFRLSLDNVNQPEIKPSDDFRHNVCAQAVNYLQQGLPERAIKFLDSLLGYYQSTDSVLNIENFRLEDLY
jgi:elongation factor P hydroxylase|tara:strand:+ start:2482 stop:3036 length:555 start_codon:yes stop_codon:yes gene_type:complete